MELLALFAVTTDLGEIDEFVGVFIEIEEHPGLAFEDGVFPTITRHDASPRAIDAELESGFTHDLEIRGVGIFGSGFTGETFGGVISAYEPIRNIQTAETK